MRTTEIEQIMPAEGWRAALVALDYDEGYELRAERLVGWALIKASRPQSDDDVAGLIADPYDGGDVYPCSEVYLRTDVHYSAPFAFLGYLRPGQSLKDYSSDAEDRYKRWRARESGDRQE